MIAVLKKIIIKSLMDWTQVIEESNREWEGEK